MTFENIVITIIVVPIIISIIVGFVFGDRILNQNDRLIALRFSWYKALYCLLMAYKWIAIVLFFWLILLFLLVWEVAKRSK